MKTRFSLWDILPIAAVAAVSAAVFLLFLPGKAPADSVEIYQNGTLMETLPLNRDGSYTLEGEYRNVVTVQNGKAAITESSCPGGDCVACGWLGRQGSIVCLPNGVEIRVITASADVDIVVR